MSLIELINKADEALVGAGEVATKGYNWVSGGTKADLTILIRRTAFLGCTITSLNKNLELGVIAGLLFTGLDCFSSKYEKRIENLESEANKNGLLNPEVERYFQKIKGIGAIELACGGVFASNLQFGTPDKVKPEEGYFIKDEQTQSEIMGTSIVLLGFAHYVMRGRNVPPRKNILRRAGEGLKKIIDEYRAEPAVSPSLVEFARVNYRS